MDRKRLRTSRAPLPVVVVLCATFVFISTNLISYFLFQHTPHIHDEIAYLFQAKIFSQGRLSVSSPCGREAFDFPHMINNGKWYSQYPPGYPLILVLGLAIGMPWLMNPLLAALAVVLFYYLGKEIYGEAEGRLAAVLGALSIWFLLTSSTMLSHTGSMVFFAFFLLFLYRSLDAPSLGNGLMAGLGLGIAFLIRPYNVAVIAVPFVVFYGFRFLMDCRRRLLSFSGFVAIILVSVACLMVYNTLTNGHPLKMGYIVSHGEGHGLGFGRQGYLGVPHTPERGLLLIGENLGAINKYLFGWPLSSLLFIVPFFIPLNEGKKWKEADLMMVLGFLSLTGGLFFYWGSHVILGPRMYFEAFPILILITARGLSKTPELIMKHFHSTRPDSVRTFLLCAVGVLTMFGFLYTFPHWVKPPHSEAFNEVLTNSFSGTSHKINGAIMRLPLRKSIVIMKYLYAPRRYFPDGWWGSGFLYDDPMLRNRIIYAQDRGYANVDLFRCYPDRDVYLFFGTLDKGMLIPLDLKEEQLQYGRPLIARAIKGQAIELVGKPQDLFLCYSSALQKTLDLIFEKYRFTDIDVVRLDQLSEQAEQAGDAVTAALLLEAALQIENDPLRRILFLGALARLYLKSGKVTDARHILSRLENLYNPHLYDVFPEKGF